jgi:DNA-binding SARP family transcriptional activator
MKNKKESLLTISTFGNFNVKKGNDYLNKVKKKSSKSWKLFSYLITYRERNVSREELIHNLNLANNSDPQGSLSALVYRLRKLIKNDSNGLEYIKTTGTAYTFNLESDYWLDVEEVETKCKKCRETAPKNPEKSYQLFKDVLNLYQGDYLEEFNTTEWFWNHRDQYKELVINTLLDLNSELKNKNKYLELWDLYNKLQQRINYDERLLKNSIESLIELGRFSTARQKLDELLSMYKDNNLIIPASIRELDRKLFDNQFKSNEIIFKENLEEDIDDDVEGAYVCKDRAVFSDLYKLEKRRFKRDKRPRCLSHLRLKSKLESEELKKHADKLLDLLANQLRAGDLVCHWQLTHFNILLMDVKEEDAEKIINRIIRYFNSEYNSEQIEIKIKNYQLCSD